MSEEDKWKALQKPFDPDEVELLPKYTGAKGADGRIPRDKYRHCDGCGGFHPFPCVHLRYVGHAGITQRLNEVDPTWNWEPAAKDQNGLPLIAGGGMWIHLTVLGVTRWGFGDAQGKTGPNAVKETIGDAIRNAAMRFGVGTYLWSKSDKDKRIAELGQPPEEAPFDLYRDALQRAKQRGIPVSDAMAYVEGVIPKPRDQYGDFEVRCAVLLVDSMRAPGRPPEEDGEEVSF